MLEEGKGRRKGGRKNGGKEEGREEEEGIENFEKVGGGREGHKG